MKPFDSAWALLKTSTVQTQLNTPSLDNTNHNALAERMWRKRKNANEPIRVPAQPEHVRHMVNMGIAKPEHFYDNIEDDIKAEQRHRKALDKKSQFKQMLNNYIPRLNQERGNYDMTVGPKSVGNIGITTAERHEPQNNWTSLDEGQIADYAQRQGLYGRALQGIINDAGSLTSYSRNTNSQPFHEQFNPPNATKEITQAGDWGDELQYNDTHEYTAKPPKETPRGWGDLQYDTGAMPVYQTRFDEGDTDDQTGQQQTLAQHTYIPTPGGVTYGRR